MKIVMTAIDQKQITVVSTARVVVLSLVAMETWMLQNNVMMVTSPMGMAVVNVVPMKLLVLKMKIPLKPTSLIQLPKQKVVPEMGRLMALRRMILEQLIA